MNSGVTEIKKIMRNHIFTLMLILNFIFLTSFILLTRLDRSGELFVKLLIFPLLIFAVTILIYEKKNIELENRNLIIFWVYTISIRFLVLFIPIGLSDDVYRYVWDGHIQHNGINPYLFSPDHVSLDPYRTNWSSNINNPHINSPYPPFAQILFFIITSFTSDIGLSIILIRIMIVGFDLGTIIIVKMILKHFSLPQRRIVIYAWSPLVIFEFAGNGHIDSIAVFFSLLALYFILAKVNPRYKIISPISLSIAFMSKVYPIILLPYLVTKWNLKEFFTFLFTTIILVLPFTNNGINPFYPKGQQSFVRYFNFNESVFRIYENYLGTYFNDPEKIARNHYIILMIIVSGLLYAQYISLSRIANQTKININIFSSFRYILLIALLLSPDVQPWYVIWMLPLAVIFYDWVIIAFSMSVLISYQIYPEYDRTGIWHENTIILTLEYLVVYLLLLYLICFRSYFRNISNVHNDKIS